MADGAFYRYAATNTRGISPNWEWSWQHRGEIIHTFYLVMQHLLVWHQTLNSVELERLFGAAIAVAAARVREAFPKEIPEETCGREHDKTAGKPCERLTNN